MSGYIEGTDRGQATLFPDRLEDWIGEDNPVRVIDLFVDEIDLAEIGLVRDGSGEDRTARLSPVGSAEALHLRLSEPRPVQPRAGAGGRSQCRGDVADGSARPGPQDDRRFSAR